MRQKLLVTFFLFAVLGNCFSQDISAQNEIDLVRAEVIQALPPTTTNFVSIAQIGDENEAISIQDFQGQLKNLALIDQTGNSNSAYSNQIGSSLETIVIQSQTGNIANIWNLGSNISTTTYQEGNYNEINSYIENLGVSRRNADYIQIGSSNYIELSILNSTNIPSATQSIEISQYGSGHSVTANLGAYSSPIEITQNPGIGGEGMKVNISTSAYGFPGIK